MKNQLKNKQKKITAAKKTLSAQPIFPNYFSQVVYLFLYQQPKQARTIYVIEMLFVMCHLSVTAIVFFELVKSTSFSILFTFRISAMIILLMFMNFSLDLNTYNINISRIVGHAWLIKILLFLKMESFLMESRTQKCQ